MYRRISPVTASPQLGNNNTMRMAGYSNIIKA